MSDFLKVLMMGGPRSGKTSALAGLVDTMVNGQVKNLISVQDVTHGDVVKQKLAQKVENLKLTLTTSVGKTIIVDDTKTDSYQNYTIEFAIPGTNNKMDIVFTDANGEFFESGREHASEISDMVKEYDVFVVAIDTPALMEAVNPENKLMNEPVNKAINNVNDIHNFISYLDDKEGADAKMVVFVPLKCEKWAREGKLDMVTERVKQVYDTPIVALMNKKNVEVDILPIQTVGNIVFQEHLKSLIYFEEGCESPKRCSLFEDKKYVRFADGMERLRDNKKDRFQMDPHSPVKEGSTILRPNSWFKVISKDYAPHNCDQLAYYILQFILTKYLFIKEIEEAKKKEEQSERKIWDIVITAVIALINLPIALIYYSYRKVKAYFGTISYDQLRNIINKLNSTNLIKTSGEGICRLKNSLLHL